MNSSLYLECSKKELADIVSETLQTEICAARLLTGGLFNTTYLVETEAYEKVVLRLGPVNRHLLMPFEHRLMEAEEYVYSLCAKQGVPVSEILAIDVTKKMIDRDFMIVRYIPSRPMNEMVLSPQDKARICYDIGTATAKMHSITAPRFGRIVDVKEAGGFLSWSGALLHELNEWERVGHPAALFTEAEYDLIRRLFEWAVPFLDQIKEPHLVHTDLWLGNILIQTVGELQFAAIIDADRAIWGDPDFEFSSIRWTYTEKSFWDGYGPAPSQEYENQIRMGIYNLLNKLWNTYVYLCEYNQPEQANREQADARQQITALEELLNLYPLS